MKDHIINEVRQARMSHAQQFNFDLQAICKDLKKKEKEYEKKYGHAIKTLHPKSIRMAKNTSSI